MNEGWPLGIRYRKWLKLGGEIGFTWKSIEEEKLHLFSLPIDFHWLLVEPRGHSEERCESLTSMFVVPACLNIEEALRNCNYVQRLCKLPWPEWIWPIYTPFPLLSTAFSLSLAISNSLLPVFISHVTVSLSSSLSLSPQRWRMPWDACKSDRI